MAITLIIRETFQSVGTLDSGSPGSLGTVNAGSFYKRAVGPRVSGDTTANSLGWSADLRISAGSTQRQHTHNISSTGAATSGVFTCWYYVSALVTSGINKGEFGHTRQSNGNQIMRVLFDPVAGNFWTNRGGDWTDRDSGIAVPIRQWFELRHTWNRTSGNSYNYTVAYRLAGSSSWVNIISGLYTFAGTIDNIVSGQLNLSGGSAGRFYGRYGMPALYSSTSYAEDSIVVISDVSDPPTSSVTWYVDALNGSDTNDGVTPSSAWLTAAKLKAESEFVGLFPGSSYATGDTVSIDTSGAPLDLLGAPLIFATSGLNIRAATGQTWATIKAHKTISAGSWSTTGTSNVYSTTDTVVTACLWEDDKWLNHPVGANFAAVSASLGSTPGSFWTDGTTMYVHPFGSTDPRSDGKTYDRTGIASGAAAIQLNGANMNCQDLYIRKTCDVDPYTNSYPEGGYGIANGGSWGGTNLVKHCYVDYCGKHGIGYTIGTSNEITTTEDCQVEQGSPYGSQTPYVSYNAGTPTNIQHYFINCLSYKFAGTIGSTAGETRGEAFYCHNNGGSDQFSIISFENCNFADSTISCTNAVTSLIVDNTIFAGDSFSGAQNKTITRSRWTKYVPNQNRSDGVLIVRNCIFALDQSVYNDSIGAIRGTVTLEGNTYDYTDATQQGGVSSPGVMVRSAATTLTFRNNALIFPSSGASKSFSVFKNFLNTDTITSTNNVILLGQSTLVKSYNDGSTTADRTFAEWQALGKDSGSSISTDLMLDASYIPKAGSPVINAGTDIGPLVDYSGTTYQVRKTAGAYEGNNILLSGFFF